MARGPGDPEDVAERAREVALALLAVRERSRSELETRLRARGFDAETVARTVGRLAEAGLVDDARFAEAYARAARRGRGLAGAALREELRARGLPAELVARATAEAPEEEEARARALAARRARRLAALPAAVQARRLAAFLARRGYPLEVCERIAREVAEAKGPEEPGPAPRTP